MLRVGIVNFINTAPFYEPWRKLGPPKGWKVIEGVPSHLNHLLKQGDLEAGLVSSFTYGEGPEDLVILRDISISATGPVKSVLFLSPIPIGAIHGGQCIVVTPKSATSVMLLRIILEVFLGYEYHRDFIFQQGDLGAALAKNSPYLAIGDEALALATDGLFEYAYDLGEIWIEETGLPFVFAVLAASRKAWAEHPDAFFALHGHIQHCLKKGLQDLEEISAKAARKIPMEPVACLEYLKGIEYDLAPEKLQGLSRFFKYLAQLGIIGAPPPLELIP